MTSGVKERVGFEWAFNILRRAAAGCQAGSEPEHDLPEIAIAIANSLAGMAFLLHALMSRHGSPPAAHRRFRAFSGVVDMFVPIPIQVRDGREFEPIPIVNGLFSRFGVFFGTVGIGPI
jgi:hypothetical protein